MSESDIPIQERLPQNLFMARQQKLVRASLVNLSLKLLSYFSKNESDNVVLSPSSLFFILSLLINGATGDTQSEILQALALEDISLDYLDQSNLGKIRDLDGSAFEAVEIANAVFVSKGISIKSEFTAIASRSYRAITESVDFSSQEDLARIDQWVVEKTHGRIKSISDTIDVSMGMALVNALYFKDDWREKFDAKDTTNETFALDSTRTKMVQMMNQTEEFGYNTFNGHQFVSMPYQCRTCDMVFVLPHSNSSPEQFLSEFSADNWAEASFPAQKLILSLPKFKLESSLMLVGALNWLGIHKLFHPMDADLKNISEVDQLFVGDVIQKVFLEVTEEGTEAAFVTEALLSIGAAFPVRVTPIEIKFNRPFLFFLRNLLNGDVLAAGIIRDP